MTPRAARAVLEHALTNEGLPIKAYYLTSCYRYEKPQAGRLREFHQFGIEEYGTSSPAADAEVITLADSIFKRLQIKDLHLEINSIGCPECRAKYNEALKAYFGARVDELCGNCHNRLEKNPMRLIDCKVPSCAEIAKDAPSILDYLCDECKSHFEQVKAYLEVAGIDYKVNPKIVRGLDYYTKTVFEFVSDAIGSQGTVCGGGRYDGLIEELGGQRLPSLGYAMGLERLLMVMENQGIEIPEPEPCALYIAGLGDKAQVKAFELVNSLRRTGLAAETDVVGRGLRAQMKYADKIGARFSMVIGDNELDENKAEVKNMVTGEKIPLALDSSFAAKFADIQLAAKFGGME